jgi:hypothetical protein
VAQHERVARLDDVQHEHATNDPFCSHLLVKHESGKTLACLHCTMVPPVGLQEGRIIKGLARGGTLKLLPASFSFPHHGVPPKRLTNKLYERLPL